MRKIFLTFGVLYSFLYNAQSTTTNSTTTPPDYSGRVGINTETPTETLDVNGNGRYRALPDANASDDHPRIVVSKTDGTLGYKDDRKALVLVQQHHAQGLNWNSLNFSGGSVVSKVWDGSLNSTTGEQNNFTNYMLFGTNSDVTVSSGGYTHRNTSFTAKAGDLLNLNALISFKIGENFRGSADLFPLNTLSVNGDRQVIIYLYLYKGTVLKRKTKQIINFNGVRNDSTSQNNYDASFSQSIGMNYSVPTGEGGTDYSVSVVVTIRAPKDGNFRIMFDTKEAPVPNHPLPDFRTRPARENDLFQHLTVSK